MGAAAKKVFLPNERDRFMLVLGLTLLYPVLVGCVFVVFLFVILPAMLTPAGVVAPLMLNPGYWLHGYWLVSLLIWALLLAVLLPLMGPLKGAARGKTVSYKRESGVSIKDDPELEPLKDGNKGKLAAVGGGAAALAAYNAVSTSATSLDSAKGREEASSSEKLMSSRDSCDAVVLVSDETTASQYGLEVRSDYSLKRSSVSLATDRNKLTQSGEFLNDCMGTLNSDDDVQGDIIRGNINCQVHAQEEDSDDDDGSAEGVALLSTVQEKDEHDSDKDADSCKEPPHEKVESQRKPSQYAEIEKAETLAQRESAPVSEALNEAMEAADSQDDLLVAQQAEVEELLPQKEDSHVVEPVLRPKHHGLPSLNTSRASQVHCSAPSTMSPMESNVVFLYVNADDEPNA